jgi:hypothetical protein
VGFFIFRIARYPGRRLIKQIMPHYTNALINVLVLFSTIFLPLFVAAHLIVKTSGALILFAFFCLPIDIRGLIFLVQPFDQHPGLKWPMEDLLNCL